MVTRGKIKKKRTGEKTMNDTDRLDWFEEHHRDFRFSGHPSMDGKFPAWIVRLPMEGSSTRKGLREAIDASMQQSAEFTLQRYQKDIIKGLLGKMAGGNEILRPIDTIVNIENKIK